MAGSTSRIDSSSVVTPTAANSPVRIAWSEEAGNRPQRQQLREMAVVGTAPVRRQPDELPRNLADGRRVDESREPGLVVPALEKVAATLAAVAVDRGIPPVLPVRLRVGHGQEDTSARPHHPGELGQ